MLMVYKRVLMPRLLLRRCATKGNLILPLGEAREGAKHTHLRRQMSAPPSEGRDSEEKNKGNFKKRCPLIISEL